MPHAAPSARRKRARHCKAGTPGFAWRCKTENKEPRAQYSSTIAGGYLMIPNKATMFGCRKFVMIETSFSSSSIATRRSDDSSMPSAPMNFTATWTCFQSATWTRPKEPSPIFCFSVISFLAINVVLNCEAIRFSLGVCIKYSPILLLPSLRSFESIGERSWDAVRLDVSPALSFSCESCPRFFLLILPPFSLIARSAAFSSSAIGHSNTEPNVPAVATPLCEPLTARMPHMETIPEWCATIFPGTPRFKLLSSILFVTNASSSLVEGSFHIVMWPETCPIIKRLANSTMSTLQAKLPNGISLIFAFRACGAMPLPPHSWTVPNALPNVPSAWCKVTTHSASLYTTHSSTNPKSLWTSFEAIHFPDFVDQTSKFSFAYFDTAAFVYGTYTWPFRYTMNFTARFEIPNPSTSSRINRPRLK